MSNFFCLLVGLVGFFEICVIYMGFLRLSGFLWDFSIFFGFAGMFKIGMISALFFEILVILGILRIFGINHLFLGGFRISGFLGFVGSSCDLLGHFVIFVII